MKPEVKHLNSHPLPRNREGAAEGGVGNSAAPERSAGAPHQSKLGAG